MFRNQKLFFPLVTIISGFLIIGSLAIHTYYAQKEVYLEGIDNQLKQAADTTELYLGTDYTDLYTPKNPPSDDLYFSYLDKLSRFAQNNGIQYVYMMVQDNDGIHIVFSSSTLEELKKHDYDDFYTPYSPSKNVLEGFKNQKSFFVSEHDKYGTFRSYCKYGRSPNGKLYMVGADISIDVLNNFVDHLIHFYTTVFLILILLVSAIFYIYFKLFQKNKHLNNLALIDKLTGLYNRQRLDDVLLEEQSKVDFADSYHCSCILLDIDHFKVINDKYGHLEGDRVLQEVSRVMEKFFRSNDTIGRWGGEEFLVLLPSTKIEDGFTLGEKLRETIENHFKESFIPVTVSVGVGELLSGISVRQSLNEIDIALYKAKKHGRNRVEIVTEEI